MSPDSNPFAALSLIVAPAILTNACSVLILSTSNRFARAVDRARQLAQEIERAMRSIYIALSGFASAALVALLGAVLLRADSPLLSIPLEALALVAGGVAVAALIHASLLPVRDTQLAVGVLQERAAGLRANAHSGNR